MSDPTELYELMLKLVEMFPSVEAQGEALDRMAGDYYQLKRTAGEGDEEFRRRVHDHLGVDEDRRFARKLETLVNQWDEEEDDSIRAKSNAHSVQSAQTGD